MRLAKILAATAALSMATVSTAAAAAAPASKLSISNAQGARAQTGIREANSQGGFPFLIVFVVLAVGAGLYFAIEEDGNESPTSP